MSDPVSFVCTCGSPGKGLILLFYRYYDSDPPLPQALRLQASEHSILVGYHTELTRNLKLGGKIRIAAEGFNITVGGTQGAVQKYIQALTSNWSMAGLDLSTPEKQREYFKPTTGGCACAFGGGHALVQAKAEITPMGVTNYLPAEWDKIETLSPEEFHERCWASGEKILIDIRNHYESRIGYFIDPISGRAAVRPAIRRFSQWPGYAKKYLGSVQSQADNIVSRHIMTYCTGGIRCEKGIRWMQENVEWAENDIVCTLKGGIAGYLTWMDAEIATGKKLPQDSLFKGRNYVFDGRGSTGLAGSHALEPVSVCHLCNKPSIRLSKCRSLACHLDLVICGFCEASEDPRCCLSCYEYESQFKEQENGRNKPRPMCLCEQQRETELWKGERQVKISKRHRSNIKI